MPKVLQWALSSAAFKVDVKIRDITLPEKKLFREWDGGIGMKGLTDRKGKIEGSEDEN